MATTTQHITAATLAFLVAMPLCAGGQASRAPRQDAVEREIRTLQDDLIAAYTHRDIDALNRILADDYTFVESHGQLLTKEQLVANFSSGDRVLSSYVIDDDHIAIYGNTAVMTYHYTSREKYRGRDESGEFRFIRVFVKQDGRWRMVAGQETRVTTQ
jgi:ketosteroid isomerase-like protein